MAAKEPGGEGLRRGSAGYQLSRGMARLGGG